jgi:hypothetical protein
MRSVLWASMIMGVLKIELHGDLGTTIVMRILRPSVHFGSYLEKCYRSDTSVNPLALHISDT